jgi:hypothetical protein
MDQASIDDVIQEALGCTICWVRKDGHPMAVWVSHAVLDGKIYVSSTENRPKTKAWLKDPRTSAVFEVKTKGAVTAVARLKLSSDAKLRTRFLIELFKKSARDQAETAASVPEKESELLDKWLEHMDTPNREIAELVVEKYLTFDQRKLEW